MLDNNTNNSNNVRCLFDYFHRIIDKAFETRDEVIEYVTNTPKPFFITCGASHWDSDNDYLPIDNTIALDIIKNEGKLSVYEHEHFYQLHVPQKDRFNRVKFKMTVDHMVELLRFFTR